MYGVNLILYNPSKPYYICKVAYTNIDHHHLKAALSAGAIMHLMSYVILFHVIQYILTNTCSTELPTHPHQHLLYWTSSKSSPTRDLLNFQHILTNTWSIELPTHPHQHLLWSSNTSSPTPALIFITNTFSELPTHPHQHLCWTPNTSSLAPALNLQHNSHTHPLRNMTCKHYIWQACMG